ncbi:uncharacterized protein LOC131155997 [Malania oleifera]|uniref:uncharacterized protein LOC131155997 n=1 Tax=Malania oleifera TaxID=397392 RepID=UPI0025ADEA40|nr:uncharacterized protein LOC131155997 [Malania oleifera]
MCNGEFFSKESDEALAFFDYLAESAQQWNTRSDRAPTTVQPLRAIGGGGRYKVKEEIDIQAHIAALARRVEAIELEKVKAAKLDEPQPNPWVYRQQQKPVHNVSGDSIETAKAVITLRSGKEVPRLEISITRQTVAPTPKVAVEVDEAKEKSEEVSPELKKSVDMEAKTSKEYQPVVPYPQRLTTGQKNKYHTEIQEIFKQVKINIPLLDAIQQVPSYAKFLKDLCIVKRKLNVKKKTFLTEQVSALILSETPQKLKDPGSPTISIMIGESHIGRALLDLGSSVNLLPFSIYEQLGLGELKKTSIVLQLVDRSVKVPRDVIKDVLVQVDKFYYPVEFVILDMQQPISTISQAPVVLGRPFLATSNALINC